MTTKKYKSDAHLVHSLTQEINREVHSLIDTFLETKETAKDDRWFSRATSIIERIGELSSEARSCDYWKVTESTWSNWEVSTRILNSQFDDFLDCLDVVAPKLAKRTRAEFLKHRVHVPRKKEAA